MVDIDPITGLPKDLLDFEEIAKELSLPLLISGGSNPEYSDWLIQNKGMSSYLIR